MLKMIKNQKDFGAVEGLLIVIIVLLVGFIGYYVWHASKKVSNLYGTSSSSSAAQPAGGKGSQDGPHTGPVKTEVFLIPEWKVSAAIPTPPKTAALIQYKIMQQDGQTWANFSTQELVEADANCTADSGAAGSISRALPTDPTYNIDGSQSSTTVQQAINDRTLKGARKVGSYYYWYGHPQAQCGNSSKVPVLQNAAEAAVKSIVDNLTGE